MNVPDDWPTAICRSLKCRAPIWWTFTQKGERLPVDPVAAEDGNLMLYLLDGEIRCQPYDKAITQPTLMGEQPPPRYRPHWADCPDADMFRTRITRRHPR